MNSVIFFRVKILILLSIAGLDVTLGQEEQQGKFSFTGYISNMQSVMFDSIGGNWLTDNLFHNRLNATWYPTEKLVFSIQVRNRFMYGETVKYYPSYAKQIGKDNGLADLSFNLLDKRSFFLNSAIDRMYFQMTNGKVVTTVGRQRINWGISTVWNPNDIFNVQNYFDFDYIEKPGSDAVRLQYYTGAVSSAEVAAKIDKEHLVTAALLYRLTVKSYDLQFISGLLRQEDFVAGMGWSGDIKKIGFKGEFTWFQPLKNFSDTSGMYLFTAGLDYMFSNSLFIQAEALFSKNQTGRSLIYMIQRYGEPLSVKDLAFADFTLFGNVSYPVTPLLNCSLAGMYFPDLKGYFAGPSIDYSVSDNMQLSLISQFFSGEFPDLLSGKKKTNIFLGFIRYKLNF
jgi:hypothetical protein